MLKNEEKYCQDYSKLFGVWNSMKRSEQDGYGTVKTVDCIHRRLVVNWNDWCDGGAYGRLIRKNNS